MLYLVPTPIGNLGDFTFRALEILKMVDLIACEDTRQTAKLLNEYKIETKTISYHQHSQLTKLDFLIGELVAGKNVALVSDAGTPAISDPGYLLIKKATEKEIEIVSLPGPSALITALAASGFSLTEFTYLGFLPHKKGRQTLFKKIAATETVFAFYESKHRIIKCLNELIEFVPTRKICLAREISKIHEEYLRGTASKILKIIEETPEKQKGEFVVIIDKN